MDEIDALRGMRTALAEEEAPERLATRISWRQAEVVRPRRLNAPLVGVAAAASVAAVSVAVVAVVPDEDALPARPAPAVQLANPLLVAAQSAQKAPEGRYWHTKRIDGKVYAVGGTAAAHYKMLTQIQYETWLDRDGSSRFVANDVPTRPLTAEDGRRWRAAGSPTRIQAPVPDGMATLFTEPLRRWGRPVPRPVQRLGAADYRFYGLTARQVARLPTEPAKLQDALLDFKGDWHAYSKDPADRRLRTLRGAERVRALSDVAGNLLSIAPAPPGVRAAAFAMLARLPGVTVKGQGKDPLGRTGTVVSLPVETTVPLGIYTAPKQLGTYRRQWIIDPAHGTLLAIRDLVAVPPHGSKALPPGDDGRPRRLTVASQPDRFHKPGEVSEYQVYTTAEWTNTAPN